MNEKKTSLFYRVLKFFVSLSYPKMELVGLENLPDGAAIVIGNHAQIHGPVAAELRFPGQHDIWCVGQMMHLKEAPAYAFQDFWSLKPKAFHWYYKICSYLIAPLAVCVFNNAHTIPVYRDKRLIETFRISLDRLQMGSKVIIFPECRRAYNHIVNDFEEHFIDTARFYYRKTGKELMFVPMYVAPKLRKLVFGKPIRFHAENAIGEERRRICDYLMQEITNLACSLPLHTVVPYQNVAKKEYPENLPSEVSINEETHC